ncbi:MAG: DoxX family protein [Thermonemataceae bacterium]
MKKFKITYWISTGLFTLLMIFSVGNYFFQTDQVKAAFESFAYPSYLVIPLGIVKIIGVVVLWFAPNFLLREWAYAGFFFNIILAFFAHLMINDGQFAGALIALVLLLTSYFSRKKAFVLNLSTQ